MACMCGQSSEEPGRRRPICSPPINGSKPTFWFCGHVARINGLRQKFLIPLLTFVVGPYGSAMYVRPSGATLKATTTVSVTPQSRRALTAKWIPWSAQFLPTNVTFNWVNTLVRPGPPLTEPGRAPFISMITARPGPQATQPVQGPI
jgi:hypothetical protein